MPRAKPAKIAKSGLHFKKALRPLRPLRESEDDLIFLAAFAMLPVQPQISGLSALFFMGTFPLQNNLPRFYANKIPVSPENPNPPNSKLGL
jgi:hypothetical protein